MAKKRSVMDVIKSRWGLCGEIARKIGTSRQNVRSWRRVPEAHIAAVSAITGLDEEVMRAELVIERDWKITPADLETGSRKAS